MLLLWQDFRVEKKKGTLDKTLPKTLFMGKFNLTEAAFQEGLQAGDFFETMDQQNRKVYAWSSSYYDDGETKSATCLA